MQLTDADRRHYAHEGWLAPLDVLTTDEAAALHSEFERAELDFPDQFRPDNRNNAHLVMPGLSALACNATIVELVQTLIGKDVTLSSSVLFVKEPSTSEFVSWHQDATYMGLAPADFVTAWVALTPSTEQSGCVAVIPRSHRDGIRPHHDTFGEDNILTRGQEIADVNPESAVNLALRPGQMSLHHPWLIHGSRPNRTDHRRIGIAFQSYLGSAVRPTRGDHHVMRIAGAGPGAEFIEVPRPSGLCTDHDVAARDRANAALADVLYEGADIRRQL